MTEFEEIDGVLFQVCDHEFTPWHNEISGLTIRNCRKCGINQYLVPKPEEPRKEKKSWKWQQLLGNND